MIVGMGMGCKGGGKGGGKGGKGDKGKPLLRPQQPRDEPATVRSEVTELRAEVAELRSEVAELRAQLQWTFSALDRQLPLMMPAPTPDTATPAPTPDTATADDKGLIGKRQRT